MVEFHSMWQLLPAMTIAKALAPYGTFWHEDPIKMDSLASLKRYAAVSPAPICASETLGTRWAFRDLLETGRGRRRDARHRLVRRPFGGAQDRRHGRGLAPAGGAARLHRPGRALRLDASFAECAECPRPGERPRLFTGPGTAIS